MRYENLTREQLLSKIEKLESDLIEVDMIKKGKESSKETIISDQNSILEFINSIAIPSAEKSSPIEFSKMLLNAVTNYTGASLATFNLYEPIKKELSVIHFDGEKGILQQFLKIAGKNILKTRVPVDDKTYQFITKNPVGNFDNFTEATFGEVPKVVDRFIRISTGINKVYPIVHVIEGKLYGTTMLAFKKGQSSPSLEMLQSYANLISVSLRRYHAENALYLSEIKYRNYLKHAPVAIFMANEKGKYTDINAQACKLLGYSKEELLALSIPDILKNKEDISKFEELKEKGKLSHEIQLITKKGSTIYARIDAIPLMNHKFMAFATDITKLKKVEKKLREAKKNAEENERKLNEAQLLSKIGSWQYITETDAVTWSQELFNIFERSTNLPAPNFSEQAPFYTEESFDILKKAVEDCVVRQIPYEIELDIITSNGAIKQIISKGAVLKDSKNKIIGSYGTAQDITKKKIIERELVAAKEKAEESDRLKSAFLANMSHEIRTPMNGILGFTSLLKKPDLNGEKKKKYISIIEKSGHRMLNTIHNIVDISKIESGQVYINLSEINLNREIEDLLAFFLPEVDKKTIQLSITKRLPDDEVVIESDKEKIDSILTNLIKNAIKYTHRGSIEIGYILHKRGSTSQFEFYVKDTGIGIPKNRLSAIFNRFEQADIEDRQAYEGSGLGLSIAKAYVEMLGGRIWVESEEGVGSQFYFTVPIVKTHQ